MSERSTQDDGRVAAGILVTLITQIIAGAALAITVEAALFVFVLDKQNPSLLFEITIGLSFACFIFSIWQGGWAITRVASDGFRGHWRSGRSHPKIALQSLCAQIGIISFIVAAVVQLGFGGPAPKSSTATESTPSSHCADSSVAHVLGRFDATLHLADSLMRLHHKPYRQVHSHHHCRHRR